MHIWLSERPNEVRDKGRDLHYLLFFIYYSFKMEKINTQAMLDSLCDGGIIASKLEHFEARQAQIDLMEMIIRCFNEDAVGAAEAGTGVGKSFAYLIPAVQFAGHTRQKVVISTATITLQRQLFDKDIPLVLKAMDLKVKAALVKGRGNYLCLRRLDEAFGESSLEGEGKQEELRRIMQWAKSSKNGSRDDISFSPSEALWSKICSDADLCMGKYCLLQDRCFVAAMRKEAAASQIIVVNHHLLFADLAARQEWAGYKTTAVLPSYSRVIIDEAHTIEDAATSFFSKEFSRIGIMRNLGRLHRKPNRGLLIDLCSIMPAYEKKTASLVSALNGIRKTAAELDSQALELCENERVFRFSPFRESRHAEKAIFPLFLALKKKLLAFTAKTAEILKQIPEEDNEEPAVWELKAILRRFESIAGICEAFTDHKNRQGEVLWIEEKSGASKADELFSKGKDWAVFTQSPVDLSKNLQESLFQPNKTVICVSATLAINGNFNYWASRCGACNANANKMFFSSCFPSPFPYSSAVLLASPTDTPLPDEQGYQDFVNHSVEQLAALAGGSALILFTSYQSLQSAWAAAAPGLQALGIRCLKQGDDDRSRLLSVFLSDESSVLFATDSFWEGVDAPGDTLRMVILCRLPFRIPNDPVFEARREAIEMSGGNPFMEISLPEAVIKFRQGFGRLIRRSSDRGIVALLDGRITKKRYGAFFLESLPQTMTSFSDFSGMLCDVENFLYR